MRSQKEILELQVKIKELGEKLKGPIAITPVPAKSEPLILPALEKPRNAPEMNHSKQSASSSRPSVVAIQGVGESLKAEIRSGKTTITVQKGSKALGGIITDISRQGGVQLKSKGKVYTLPFQE